MPALANPVTTTRINVPRDGSVTAEQAAAGVNTCQTTNISAFAALQNMSSCHLANENILTLRTYNLAFNTTFSIPDLNHPVVDQLYTPSSMPFTVLRPGKSNPSTGALIKDAKIQHYDIMLEMLNKFSCLPDLANPEDRTPIILIDCPHPCALANDATLTTMKDTTATVSMASTTDASAPTNNVSTTGNGPSSWDAEYAASYNAQLLTPMSLELELPSSPSPDTVPEALPEASALPALFHESSSTAPSPEMKATIKDQLFQPFLMITSIHDGCRVWSIGHSGHDDSYTAAIGTGPEKEHQVDPIQSIVSWAVRRVSSDHRHIEAKVLGSIAAIHLIWLQTTTFPITPSFMASIHVSFSIQFSANIGIGTTLCVISCTSLLEFSNCTEDEWTGITSEFFSSLLFQSPDILTSSEFKALQMFSSSNIVSVISGLSGSHIQDVEELIAHIVCKGELDSAQLQRLKSHISWYL
ncbi:hypothetical protein EDD85DRAFT_794095 [Armillaria nabsnona]|nr:hypothetical protein EDD85DRAFT_794095 [Armillaria nabsnona]